MIWTSIKIEMILKNYKEMEIAYNSFGKGNDTMVIDWNIHIEQDFNDSPRIKIIKAVPDKYHIIFITASTWEDATKARDQILRQEESKNET